MQLTEEPKLITGLLTAGDKEVSAVNQMRYFERKTP